MLLISACGSYGGGSGGPPEKMAEGLRTDHTPMKSPSVTLDNKAVSDQNDSTWKKTRFAKNIAMRL